MPPRRLGYVFDLVESPPSSRDCPTPAKRGPHTVFPFFPTPPDVGPIRFPDVPPPTVAAVDGTLVAAGDVVAAADVVGLLLAGGVEAEAEAGGVVVYPGV